MAEAAPAYRLGEFVAYFLRPGPLGFGGPIALVGAMRRDLVNRRGWVSESDYGVGLAREQLAPGPLAAAFAAAGGAVPFPGDGSEATISREAPGRWRPTRS